MVATEKIPLNVHRFDTWNFHLSDSWLNICVDYFTRFSTVGSLRLGRKRTFFVLPKFPSDVNQTLQFHLHRWIHFLLTGFDPVWPKPACTYRTSPLLQHAEKDRTSFVHVKPGNQGVRKEISALELNANFYSIIPNFFFPSHSVSLVKVVCHLQKLRKIRSKSEWDTAFRVVPVKNVREQHTIWKVVLSFSNGIMFQTEISVLFVKPFLKYQFQAFARGCRQLVNTIPE